MTTYDEALGEWARRKVIEHRPQIQSEIEIEDVSFGGGGMSQIGEMTWDYDDYYADIVYSTKSRKRVNFRYFAKSYGSFGDLVREICGIALEMERS